MAEAKRTSRVAAPLQVAHQPTQSRSGRCSPWLLRLADVPGASIAVPSMVGGAESKAVNSALSHSRQRHLMIQVSIHPLKPVLSLQIGRTTHACLR